MNDEFEQKEINQQDCPSVLRFIICTPYNYDLPYTLSSMYPDYLMEKFEGELKIPYGIRKKFSFQEMCYLHDQKKSDSK